MEFNVREFELKARAKGGEMFAYSTIRQTIFIGSFAHLNCLKELP